jgi:hypothetical protein
MGNKSAKTYCIPYQISLRKKRKFKVHSHLFFALYEHLLVILLGVYENLCGLKVLIRRPGINIPSRDVRNIYWNLLKETGVIKRHQGTRSEPRIKIKNSKKSESSLLKFGKDTDPGRVPGTSA